MTLKIFNAAKKKLFVCALIAVLFRQRAERQAARWKKAPEFEIQEWFQER
jgi:hypothetical protein